MKQRFIIVALCLLVASLHLSCGTKDGGDSGDDLTPEQKVGALSVFLPWSNLRAALDQASAAPGEVTVNEEARAIAVEIQKLCTLRRNPETVGGRDLGSAESTDRVEMIEIAASTTRPNCPIRFRERLVIKRELIGQNQETTVQVDVAYSAVNQQALAVVPVARLNYRGTIKSKSGPAQGELSYYLRENVSGRIEMRGEEVFPISSEREVKTRFRGTESRTEETTERSLQIGNRKIEWRQERDLSDLKLSAERNFLNRQKMSAAEYEKLRGEATRKNRFP